nr:prepilin peptidase [Angustibacter aerolatus]
MTVLLAVLCGVLGLAIGSFLNVVVWRVPRGESVAHPPSACPRCGHPIRPRDNVPVLGWLLLRGRCRDCGEPISARYPVVEALTGLLFAAVAVRFGLAWEPAGVPLPHGHLGGAHAHRHRRAAAAVRHRQPVVRGDGRAARRCCAAGRPPPGRRARTGWRGADGSGLLPPRACCTGWCAGAAAWAAATSAWRPCSVPTSATSASTSSWSAGSSGSSSVPCRASPRCWCGAAGGRRASRSGRSCSWAPGSRCGPATRSATSTCG